MTQVWVFSAQTQYFPLDQGTFDVVVLKYHVLLQALDGEVVLGALLLR